MARPWLGVSSHHPFRDDLSDAQPRCRMDTTDHSGSIKQHAMFPTITDNPTTLGSHCQFHAFINPHAARPTKPSRLSFYPGNVTHTLRQPDRTRLRGCPSDGCPRIGPDRTKVDQGGPKWTGPEWIKVDRMVRCRCIQPRTMGVPAEQTAKQISIFQKLGKMDKGSEGARQTSQTSARGPGWLAPARRPALGGPLQSGAMPQIWRRAG